MQNQKLVDYWVKGGDGDFEVILEEKIPLDIPKIIIFDDQSKRRDTVIKVSRLFSIEGRHTATGIIWISQSIFDGYEMKQIRNNSDYLVLFRCPSDCLSVSTLSGQVMGNNSLFKIYLDATKEPYSYLLIDQTQESQREKKFLSNIFDESGKTVFSYLLPK